MKETSAGVIIYRRTKEGPKFLLLYHGGRYWNFPKGKIEESGGRETAFRAALREVKEETGLSSHDLRLNNRFKSYDNYTFTKQGKKVFKTVIYYLAETNKKEIKISEEHSGWAWFLYRDALRFLIYGNLKNNLRRAYETVRGKSLRRRKENPAG
ncbi:MAG: NUDIX domain-containing protein [Candidatus Brennerbacteria bacterium]|nr:NUDIX domain-containing protein [Candidatus Brennerbacteria bacterium]